MAKQPDDLVTRILQEIQATQAEQGRVLEEHSHHFPRLEKTSDDIREGMIAALGLSKRLEAERS